MSGGNYVRVYSSILTDDKFHGLSLAMLGAWLKLLIYADEMYPAPAPLPRWVGDDMVRDLVDRGIVDMWGDDHYKVRGLEKERERRSQLARQNARSRWDKRDEHSDGNAPAMQPHSSGNASQAKPSQAEPSQAKPSQAEPDAAQAYYDLKGGQASAKAIDFVDDIAREFGDEATIEEMGRQAKAGPVDREFLSRVKSALTLAAHQQEKAAAARRKAADAKYEADLQARIENATPEERERAERIKRGIAGFLKGGAT